MANKKSDLPVATRDLAGADQAIEKIQTPAQAEETKLWFKTLQELFKKRGLFEEGFKASEIWTKADRKLRDLIGKSGLTEDALAKALNTTKSAVKTLRSELKRAYDKPQDFLEKIKQEAYEKKEYLTRKIFIKGGQTSMFSKDPEWNTPSWIYERARLIMGSIDLDPATNQEAIDQGNVATRYFTKEDDGLKQDWGRQVNVFCNPPYSLENKASGAKAFLIKLMASDYKQAVFITIEDSGTSYGQFLWPLCTSVFIPRGRVAFSDQNKNTRSSLVWGIGVDELKFKLAFQRLGHIETRYKTSHELRELFEKQKRSLAPWLKRLKGLPRP